MLKLEVITLSKDTQVVAIRKYVSRKERHRCCHPEQYQNRSHGLTCIGIVPIVSPANK